MLLVDPWLCSRTRICIYVCAYTYFFSVCIVYTVYLTVFVSTYAAPEINVRIISLLFQWAAICCLSRIEKCRKIERNEEDETGKAAKKKREGGEKREWAVEKAAETELMRRCVWSSIPPQSPSPQLRRTETKSHTETQITLDALYYYGDDPGCKTPQLWRVRYQWKRERARQRGQKGTDGLISQVWSIIHILSSRYAEAVKRSFQASFLLSRLSHFFSVRSDLLSLGLCLYLFASVWRLDHCHLWLLMHDIISISSMPHRKKKWCNGAWRKKGLRVWG